MTAPCLWLAIKNMNRSSAGHTAGVEPLTYGEMWRTNNTAVPVPCVEVK